jgi:hypothetical protein
MGKISPVKSVGNFLNSAGCRRIARASILRPPARFFQSGGRKAMCRGNLDPRCGFIVVGWLWAGQDGIGFAWTWVWIIYCSRCALAQKKQL